VLCRTIVLAAAVLGTLLHPARARTQTDPPPDAPPPPWGDLASDEDPSLRFDDPQFELPLDLYIGSPVFLEPPTGDQLDYVPPGGDPTFSANMDAVDVPGPFGPVTCSGVAPLRLAANKPRYFSYANVPRMLVGVSADSGCALSVPQGDQCSLTNYAQLFTLAHNAGLNKVQVWVGMGYGYPAPYGPPNAPFSWITPATGSAYWLLDSQATATGGFAAFFDRLRAVVDMARSQKLFVEVTFFSPFEGQAFNLGPWSKPGAKARSLDPAAPGGLATAGFTSPFYFVTNDTTSPAAAANEKMRAVQANVIKWTVEALWCYDNIFFAVANEPEGQATDVDNVKKVAEPLAVTQWQKSMIYEVRKAEKAHSPALLYGHLIAVQPFTNLGAGALLQPTPAPPGWQLDPNFPLDPQILNGHYTQVSLPNIGRFPSATTTLDLGAMDMIRSSSYNKKNMPLGFNENAITNLGGERGTKRHLNGSANDPSYPQYSDAPARAEAWEFLFSGGSTYDHFGYLGLNQLPNPNTLATNIRAQLGRLLSLFDNRFGLVPKPALTDFQPAVMPSWFTPGTYRAWDSRTKSQRYWAALEVPISSGDPNHPHKALLFYIHHSTVRCKPDTNDYNSGCPSNSLLPFGSYDARIWTVSPPAGGPAGYQETYTPLTNGSYTVTWIDPETTTTLATQTITCPSNCVITSPVYKFDILLKLFRQ
jgi:hypothetical protein